MRNGNCFFLRTYMLRVNDLLYRVDNSDDSLGFGFLWDYCSYFISSDCQAVPIAKPVCESTSFYNKHKQKAQQTLACCAIKLSFLKLSLSGEDVRLFPVFTAWFPSYGIITLLTSDQSPFSPRVFSQRRTK